MANTSTRGILLTMLSAVTFGFAFTLGPMTYGEAGSNPVILTFLRNFFEPAGAAGDPLVSGRVLCASAPKNCGA
ncbi:MAG: hypothetical protein LUH17_07040 [Acidaminococcaceae bacterium]|nr:hypothetical protein [Acidaminococcaceae bacterium]